MAGSHPEGKLKRNMGVTRRLMVLSRAAGRSSPAPSSIRQKSGTLQLSESGTLARYVLVAALSRALRLGRRLTAAVLFMPRAEGWSGSPARRAGRSRGACGNAAYVAVQAGSSWVPAAPRTGRPRQCGGRRVNPLSPIKGQGHAGVLEHLERATGIEPA